MFCGVLMVASVLRSRVVIEESQIANPPPCRSDFLVKDLPLHASAISAFSASTG